MATETKKKNGRQGEGGGRKPITMTNDQLVQIEALAAYLSQEQIADYFGMGKTTWFAIMERQPEVAERYKKGKAAAIGAVAQGLLTKARAGDTASAIFYLKTQAGWKETTHIDHSSTDGTMTPKKTENVVTIEDAQRIYIDMMK